MLFLELDILNPGFVHMNRYFIELSFKGTHYHGWQSQQNAVSVQSVVESALQMVTREKIKTTGAGRTDAGVHARVFYAHFDSNYNFMQDVTHTLYKLNALLPPDILILKMFQVRSEAHARYSAVSRVYEYTITCRKDPFDLDFSWHYPVLLNIKRMNQASKLLISVNDFTSFSKLHSNTKNNICHVKNAIWRKKGDKLLFQIEADRFLRDMVRAIVGTLVDVGRGKISIFDFTRIIEGRNRKLASGSVPAKGLSIKMITYPSDIIS
jgi:tRNA pseudouridine38-40 synthase